MKIEFSEGSNTKSFEKEVEIEMEKQILHFEKELLKIRTGRANSAMVEDIKVECYGNLTPLKGVASITIPDATMIIIQPWDKSVITEIEKALSNSDLGINPINDGNVIRIQLPHMSAARRDELVKVLHQKLESCKVAVRNVRKEVQNLIRENEKSKKISEDFSKRLLDVLQKITDRFIDTSDKVALKKEQEIKH